MNDEQIRIRLESSVAYFKVLSRYSVRGKEKLKKISQNKSRDSRQTGRHWIRSLRKIWCCYEFVIAGQDLQTVTTIYNNSCSNFKGRIVK
jgi:hypothetical protein